jgi:hypothetical protein
MKSFFKILWLRMMDFFDPIVVNEVCGCGDRYPDSTCTKCHGTGDFPIHVLRLK